MKLTLEQRKELDDALVAACMNGRSVRDLINCEFGAFSQGQTVAALRRLQQAGLVYPVGKFWTTTLGVRRNNEGQWVLPTPHVPVGRCPRHPEQVVGNGQHDSPCPRCEAEMEMAVEAELSFIHTGK